MLLNFKNLSLFALFFTAAVGPAYSYSSGPPIGKAGEPPAGSNCTDCHSGVVNSGPGTMELITPEFYEFGQTYTIELHLTETGAARWGFEVVALDDTDSPAGSMAISDPAHTQVDGDYVMQTQRGSYAGVDDGPVSWMFEWTAPDGDVGPVVFFVAGNAANNDGGTSGDHIYVDALVVDAAVAVQSMSWSALKRF
jgi:hypothetical protein